jgi:putative FmdB family regulatory protein
MPLYEYLCDACGHRFEKIQKFSDPLEDTCPKCGGPVHKLMSSPAIQFKGSGFYITDYAKKDYVNASKADGKSEGGSGDSGGKTEKADGGGNADAGAKTEKTEKAEKSTSSDATSSPSAPPPKPASTPTSKE